MRTGKLTKGFLVYYYFVLTQSNQKSRQKYPRTGFLSGSRTPTHGVHLNALQVVMLSLSKHGAGEKRTDWLRRTSVPHSLRSGRNDEAEVRKKGGFRKSLCMTRDGFWWVLKLPENIRKRYKLE
jgi:hypothetical protein